MKLPKYAVCKRWINFIDLQCLGLSYTAIGIYVCVTSNKFKEFDLKQLALPSNPNTLLEIEYAIEELLTAGLVELMPVGAVQGGAA